MMLWRFEKGSWITGLPTLLEHANYFLTDRVNKMDASDFVNGERGAGGVDHERHTGHYCSSKSYEQLIKVPWGF